jgi:hypothetical protein
MHAFLSASDGEVGSGNRRLDSGVRVGRLRFAETKIELNIGLTDGLTGYAISPVASGVSGASFDDHRGVTKTKGRTKTTRIAIRKPAFDRIGKDCADRRRDAILHECPDSEVRIIVLHPRLRTSELKGH